MFRLICVWFVCYLVLDLFWLFDRYFLHEKYCARVGSAVIHLVGLVHPSAIGIQRGRIVHAFSRALMQVPIATDAS